MIEKKKLGRPKGKNKPKDAEWLFHEWLSAEDKIKIERVRLAYRCYLYDSETHRATPSALPKVSNKLLLHHLVNDCYNLFFGGDMPPQELEKYLRKKGCMNADELLPEGLDK